MSRPPTKSASGLPAAAELNESAQPADIGGCLVSLHEVIARLRRECPWDQAQTHGSLARYALNEASELAEALQAAQEALDRSVDDDAETDNGTQAKGTQAQGTADPRTTDAATAIEDLVEELGDVLLQVLLNAAIGEQAGTFTLAEVIQTVEAKMVRRHPHVFERDPNAPALTQDELSQQWERIKAAERATREHRIAERRSFGTLVSRDSERVNADSDGEGPRGS